MEKERERRKEGREEGREGEKEGFVPPCLKENQHSWKVSVLSGPAVANLTI